MSSEQISAELQAQLIETVPEYSKKPERRFLNAIEKVYAENKRKLLREEVEYCEFAAKYIASAFGEITKKQQSGDFFIPAKDYKSLLPIKNDLVRLWRIRNRFNGHERDMEEFLYSKNIPEAELWFDFDTGKDGEVLITSMRFKHIKQWDKKNDKDSRFSPKWWNYKMIG